jgi:hypothetical protein
VSPASGASVWLNDVPIIVSGIELFIKVYSVNRKVKQTAGSLARRGESATPHSASPEQVISPEFLETRRPSVEKTSDVDAVPHELKSDQNGVLTEGTPNARGLDSEEEPEELEEFEEDEYFEL